MNTVICRLSLRSMALDLTKLESAQKGGKTLYFEQVGVGTESLSGDYPLQFTTQRALNHVFGGVSGETIHYMRLKEPLPDRLKLRVVTYTATENGHVVSKSVPGDTVLTFELSPPDANASSDTVK